MPKRGIMLIWQHHIGMIDVGFFTHLYDIRATVELENGEMYKVHCPIEARLVTREELLEAFKREVKWRLGSPVRRIIEIYDATDM